MAQIVNVPYVMSSLRKSFRVKASINVENIKRDFQKLSDNLLDALYLELDRLGKDVSRVMVSRFDETAVYKKPSRITGAIRFALNQHSVVKYGNKLTLKIGNKNILPYYFKYQEHGTKPYTFQEKFAPLRFGYINKPQSRMSFSKSVGDKNVRWVSFSNEWFASHPNTKVFTFSIRHPGIRKRGFVSTGETYFFFRTKELMQRVFDLAIKGKM